MAGAIRRQPAGIGRQSGQVALDEDVDRLAAGVVVVDHDAVEDLEGENDATTASMDYASFLDLTFDYLRHGL